MAHRGLSAPARDLGSHLPPRQEEEVDPIYREREIITQVFLVFRLSPCHFPLISPTIRQDCDHGDPVSQLPVSWPLLGGAVPVPAGHWGTWEYLGLWPTRVGHRLAVVNSAWKATPWGRGLCPARELSQGQGEVPLPSCPSLFPLWISLSPAYTSVNSSSCLHRLLLWVLLLPEDPQNVMWE